MSSSPERDDDTTLDELLATARWPEPSAASERRLRAAWLALSPAQGRPRPLRWRAYSVAAGTAAAAVVLALVLRRDPGATVTEPAKPGLVAQRPTRPDAAPRGPSTAAPAPWRPAVPWEVALVSARPRASATSRARTTVESRPQSLNARVDQAVESVASGRAADVVASELRVDFRPERVEQRLTPMVLRLTNPRRAAAVRLLAHVATARSGPVLAGLCADPEARADAVAGLIRVGDVPTLAAVAATASDDAERRQLLAALLRRDPDRALPVYLAFLTDDTTAAAALDALDDLPGPPVDALFARLNDPRRANRLAAARALGRIDGPAVTARLVAMALHNVNRHEALAALACSGGAEAKAFFEWALSSKELGASARTARAGLDHL